ncbi:MAG: hypothetical protein NT032_00010, partial [Actinobacteria bacterium]|nr:hypothetical protein [Actinomycetota bacterium]
MLEALHGKVVGLDKISTLPLIMPAMALMEEEYRAYRDPMAAGLREEDMEYRGERGFVYNPREGQLERLVALLSTGTLRAMERGSPLEAVTRRNLVLVNKASWSNMIVD